MSPKSTISAPLYDAIVALGSNIGDKAGHIAAAIDELTRDGKVSLVKPSANYRTAPWGITDQDWFVNAVISVATELPVHDLLARCQGVEQKLGRERTIKWGPRVIDLDILVYRDLTLNEPSLILPHPHITDRAFVLRPLADVAPNLVLKGHTVTDWLTRVPHDDVVPL